MTLVFECRQLRRRKNGFTTCKYAREKYLWETPFAENWTLQKSLKLDSWLPLFCSFLAKVLGALASSSAKFEYVIYEIHGHVRKHRSFRMKYFFPQIISNNGYLVIWSIWKNPGWLQLIRENYVNVMCLSVHNQF